MHTSFRLALALSIGALLITGCGPDKSGKTTKVETVEKPAGIFQDWPTNADPRVVGESLARNLVARNLLTNRSGCVVYPEACAGFGAVRFAKAAGNPELLQKLTARYSFFVDADADRLVSTNAHVDFRVLGIIPLQIYLDTGDTNFLRAGRDLADKQWADPLPDGLTRETRWWVDDTFMVGSLQIEAWRATKDPQYADRAALQLAAYLDKLQQTNGLFYHGPAFPHFWGRGNGWFAVALAEVLSSLPPDHPKYARLMEGYRKMMAGLRGYQAPSGLWRQLIDNDQSWVETSCTGMFSYAIIVGVQRGWLDVKEYGDCARRGWIGLCGYVNEDGAIREICIGTGQNLDTQYYLDRPRSMGDLHGQAPALWCAWALLQK